MFIPTSIATLLVQNLLPSYQNNLPIDSSISATTGPMFTLSPSGNSIPMSTGKQEKRAIPTMIYDDVTTTANCTTTSIVTVTRGRREDGVIEADNADSAYTDVFQTSVLDSYSIGTGVAPTSTLDSHETKSWRNQWRNHTYTRSHIRSTLGPMASPPPAVVAAPTVKNTTISVLSIDAIFPFTLTTLPAYTTPSNSSIIWYTTSEAASASLPPIYAPPAGAEDEEDAADVVEENVMGGVEGLTFKETPPATSSSPSVNAAATSPTLLVNLAITSLTLSVNSAVIGAVIVDLAKTSGVMSTPVPAPTSVAVSYTSGGWVYIRHTSSIA